MKKLYWLISLFCVAIICFLGINSSTKTVTVTGGKDLNAQNNQFYGYGGGSTTFDHIDIQSVASFTYYVDGKPVKVNINFYEDESELSNVRIYKKNKNGSLTQIEVKGSWRNQDGSFDGVSTEMEYSIPGTFDRYYDNISREEVIYVVEFTLSVTIGGVEQQLVYTEEYSYNSSNNVCPGKTFGWGQGIDVLISGTKLEDFFSSSLKVIKKVENADDNTFKFNVKAVNSNINFNKDIEIKTNDGSGFITLGGLKAGEKYIIKEIDIPEGYELASDGELEITAVKNKTVEVTFTNRSKTIDVSGTKIWNDNNNQDGIRPEEITVNLLKNGEKIDSVVVGEENDWAYSFNDLPEYENGKKNEYTVEEVDVDGYKATILGYDITNKHVPEKISISGTKTWDDNDDQDGIRPKFIVVKLFKNGDLFDFVNVTEIDDWSYSFNDLDKYEDGEEITYTIDEELIDGYETEIDGYDITNTHTPEKISVTGTKTWNDNDNQDGKRPEEITVRLYADGEEVAHKKVTEKNDWSYTFSDLDKYESGKAIVYTVSEDEVDGYEVEVNGYNITNTHTPEKISISGTKEWSDSDNQDGIRPNEIIVRLYANGEEVAHKKVTVEDNWSYTFSDLDKYESGKAIVYTVSEDEVDGYEVEVNGYNITNTHAPEKISISGTKEWSDSDNQDGIRPNEITVRLYADGVEVDSKVVTSEDEWKYTFDGLDKYKDGVEIVYTVSEDKVDGYEVEVNGYNIKNTHTPEKISINGTKTWDDNDNQDGKRPVSITVRLYADGVEVDSKVVTSEDEWKYTFSDLDKYKDGVEIVYTVSEDKVDGYEVEVNGYDITNTHTSSVISVSGTKSWDDSDNQDGIRPNEITVRLYANGKEVSSKKITEKDNWKYTFDNLAEYSKGSKIEYTVKEDKVDGYTAVINGYDIKNVHETEKITVSGTKIWDDNNNQDGIRPNEITVKLYANGKEVDSKKVTVENNWSYTFSDLDKYENGTEIIYTVGEDKVDGYEVKVDGYNITNIHIPSVISISGTKSWDDSDNQDGIRPDSIVVNLYANGEKIDSQVVSSESGWTYTFGNLEEYNKGSKVGYTVKEDKVDGYTAVINGYDIKNVHETEKTTVSGIKTWSDNNNQDGIRSDEITVRLYADGIEVDSKVVTSNDEWKYTFDGLDKYKDGVEIVYTVSEDEVDGYETKIDGYNITNTHTPETTRVVGKKVWNDNDNQDGKRPVSITVRLYADGVEVNNANVTSGDTNNWTYAFIDLPKYKNGVEINYTVSEDAVEYYETTYDQENPYIIINTHETEKVNVNGTKTWDDNDNQDGIRPDSIVVKLYENGIEVDSKEISEEDNWTYSFDNLDMYKEGKLISYTISEDVVEGYSVAIDGYDITNTHTPEKIGISGAKTWNDNDNQDGIRPEYIIVNLLKDNEVLDTVIVTEENDWTYAFNDLDKYENGSEIQYTLTEEVVEGYATEIDGYDIVNTHEVEKITFRATKVWDDNDNQDGLRQKEVNVKLYKNGKLFDEVKITEEDNWTYVFENLDRYENGVEVVYTIIEDVVLGYDVEINYDDIDENNIVAATIINTHVPDRITIDINKTWNDDNNSMLIRPDNIEVDLFGNGEYLKTIVITGQNNWKYSIDGLDKYQNGTEIVYTIMEKEVDGYKATYDKFNIINTITVGRGGDVEILPPQTGIDNDNYNYIYSLVAIIFTTLFMFVKKFV